jgi:hypothetical protein
MNDIQALPTHHVCTGIMKVSAQRQPGSCGLSSRERKGQAMGIMAIKMPMESVRGREPVNQLAWMMIERLRCATCRWLEEVASRLEVLRKFESQHVSGTWWRLWHVLEQWVLNSTVEQLRCTKDIEVDCSALGYWLWCITDLHWRSPQGHTDTQTQAIQMYHDAGASSRLAWLQLCCGALALGTESWSWQVMDALKQVGSAGQQCQQRGSRMCEVGVGDVGEEGRKALCGRPTWQLFGLMRTDPKSQVVLLVLHRRRHSKSKVLIVGWNCCTGIPHNFCGRTVTVSCNHDLATTSLSHTTSLVR